MKKSTRNKTRSKLPERLQRRFRVARPGSVLILCVALLVLLALIGTAMISTTRVDRYSVVQNTTNTQLDLLMDSMKQTAVGVITNDLYDTAGTTPRYRPPYNYASPATSTYDHRDMPAIVSAINAANAGAGVPIATTDLWLAPRFPDFNYTPNPPSFSAAPVWRGLTAPIVNQMIGTSGIQLAYDSPQLVPGSSLYRYPYIRRISIPLYAYPTFVSHPDLSPGPPYPALAFRSNFNSGTFLGNAFIAADADGDGIADAGLNHIPGADANGISYYVGFRIIDNNSAINVNTAWSRQFDYNCPFPVNTGSPSNYSTGAPIQAADENANGTATGTGKLTDARGYFRSNVGLLELLNSYNTARPPGATQSTEMDALNIYRFGNGSFASSDPGALAHTVQDSNWTLPFNYLNQGDALENGLARRLDYPDINFGIGNGSFAAFSLADQASLAAHFCVAPPTRSSGVLESLLSSSLVNVSARRVPYLPVDQTAASYAPMVAKWYADNFDWTSWPTNANGTPLNHRPWLRSSLVARNPVSNQIPVVTYPAATSAAPFQTNPLIPTSTLPNMATMAPYSTGTITNSVATGSIVMNATKTDINTATFPELWRAYWSVMADADVNAGSVDTSLPPWNTINDAAGSDGGGKMFRQSIRNLTANGFNNSAMLELRSALAAVNAMDLRDADESTISIGGTTVLVPGNITNREIPINTVTTTPQNTVYSARVYGTEKQPFITEVYVNTDVDTVSGGKNNPNGYIAVELYNPYNVPLGLNQWAIGTIARGAPGNPASPLTVTPLNTAGYPLPTITNTATPSGYGTAAEFLAGGNVGGLPAVVIPANGYVVLENYAGTPGAAVGTDANYRPPEASTVNIALTVYVPDLAQAIGNELVLLRPHLSRAVLPAAGYAFTEAGTSILSSYLTPLAGVADQPGTYNEGTSVTPFLQDFVPVDCYDFTNLPPPVTGSAAKWHYARANGPTALWKCVYPGKYTQATVAPNSPRFLATDATAQWNPNTNPSPVLPAPPVNLGAADPVATNGTSPILPFPGIQLCNYDWANNNLPQVQPNVFPFGSAFARNGDIVQAPFIGAYQIKSAISTPTEVGPATSQGAPTCTELNAVTIDSSFADDDDTTDDANEQIGRFAPIENGTIHDCVSYDTSVMLGYNAGNASCWRYHFAERLFDYLTVQAPASDLKPNHDPSLLYAAQKPVPVQNGSTYLGANGSEETKTGVDGLVNINTAPWWVIASLPLLPNDVAVAGPMTPEGFPQNIENLAKLIVQFRDGDPGTATTEPPNVVNQVPHPNGPFRSIWDLTRIPSNNPSPGRQYVPTGSPPGIPAFADAMTPGVTNAYVPAGYPPSTAGVTGDFEQKLQMVNRISNLITTRSDTFTVYIVIQGWRNAGTAKPSLVVQKRAAYIVDRTPVTAAGGSAKVTAIAND